MTVVNAPRVAQAGNVYEVAVPDDADLADGATLVIVKSPPLIAGVTKIAFVVSTVIVPGTGVTGITPTINHCDEDGVYLGNVAFWTPADFAPGDAKVFAAAWFYDPRPGDGNHGDSDDTYFGLHLNVVGGTAAASSSFIQATAGGFQSSYWPAP